jgi:hypothetical protein
MKKYLAILAIGATFCTNISYAQAQKVSNEWAQLSSDERLCYNLSVKKNNNSNIEQLIQNNISPNDQRLAGIKQQCQAFLNQNFKKNYRCDFNINGSMVSTLCDEDYAIQGPNGIQRLSVEQALNLLAQDKPIARGYFETAQAIQARQNGSSSVNAETIAKNTAAEEQRQRLAQQKAAEEQAARTKEADRLALQKLEEKKVAETNKNDLNIDYTTRYVKAWDIANRSPAWCSGYISFKIGYDAMKVSGLSLKTPGQVSDYGKSILGPNLETSLDSMHEKAVAENKITKKYLGARQEYLLGETAFNIDCSTKQETCVPQQQSCLTAFEYMSKK